MSSLFYMCAPHSGKLPLRTSRDHLSPFRALRAYLGPVLVLLKPPSLNLDGPGVGRSLWGMQGHMQRLLGDVGPCV